MEEVEAFVPVPDTIVPLLSPEVVSSRILRRYLPDEVRAALAEKVKPTWFYQEGWPRRLSESLAWTFDTETMTVSFAQPQVAVTLAGKVKKSEFRHRLLYPLLDDTHAALFRVELPVELIEVLSKDWQRESTTSTWLELLWSVNTPLSLRREIADKLLVKRPKTVAAAVAALAFSEIPDEELVQVLLTPAATSHLDKKKLDTFMTVLFTARPSLLTLTFIETLPAHLRTASLAAASGHPLAPADVLTVAVTEALADSLALPYAVPNAVYSLTTPVEVAHLLLQHANSQSQGAINARLTQGLYGLTVETMSVDQLLTALKACTRRYQQHSQFDPGRLQKTANAAVFAAELMRRLPYADVETNANAIDAVYEAAAEAAVVGLVFPGCSRHQLLRLFEPSRKHLLDKTTPEARAVIFGPQIRNSGHSWHFGTDLPPDTRVQWRTLTAERDFHFDCWDAATERYLAEEIVKELGTAPSAWSFLFSLLKQHPTTKLGDLVQLAAAT